MPIAAQPALDLIYSTLNFPGNQRITLPDLRHGQARINTWFTYLDGYRKYRTGDEVLSWRIPAWKGEIFFPQSLDRFDAAWRIKYYEGYQAFSNRSDNVSTHLDMDGVSRDLRLQFALSDGRALLGGGFDVGMTGVHSPLEIARYPQSENSRMNRYFYDWLPLTFGHQLEAENEKTSFRPTVFASLPVQSGAVISAQYRYAHSTGSPDLIYTNNTNKTELRGPRRITFRNKGYQNFVRLGYTHPKQQCTITIDVIRSRLISDIDNHPPETTPILLDFTSLGNGELDRVGGNIRWRQSVRSFRVSMGIGYSELAGSFSLRTPVLGYYDNLLPISHGVSGTLTGTVFSQDGEIRWKKDLHGFSVASDIRYTHSYTDFVVDGAAALEFNLISEPIRQPLQYSIHLLQAKISLARQVRKVRIGYELGQTLPYVERVDSGEIRFGEPRQPSELSHHGGRFHVISISYSL